MKRILGLSVMIIALFSACGKDDNDCAQTESTLVAPASEIQVIQQHLTTNSLTATQDPSGIFYNISVPGTGDSYPGLCTQVSVKYRGTFLNGTVFDESSAPITYPLGGFIVGWQKGVAKLKKGGKMKLYVPPTLGYGNVDRKDSQGNVVIPANSTLIFDIELVNF